MKKILYFLLSGLLLTGCDYLDVVPDNVATMDNAFTDRVSAEKFLFTCYSYLPAHYDPNKNPAFIGGDENMLPPVNKGYFGSSDAFQIAKGFQNSNDPYLNYWDGNYPDSKKTLFIALRDCNIFFENIDKPIDLESYTKKRWIAEVKFLKAYYHFYLLRMYGPIPIIRTNLPVSATPEEVKVYRDPVDEVCGYIVSLLDEAMPELPLEVQRPTTEQGRITRPIAAALKAKALVLAASPLFNGNPDYAGYKDKRGIALFPETYDREKWDVAAKACKQAIDICKAAGHDLFYFESYRNLSEQTKVKMNIRGAVTEKWNREIIWGSTANSQHLQRVSMPRLGEGQFKITSIVSELAPTLRIAEQFYSGHGVPISEDISWDYEHRYETRTAAHEDRFYIREGYETAKLHFDREPRFYASLGFDGGVWYGAGVLDDDTDEALYVRAKMGQAAGVSGAERYSASGYFCKKLINFESVIDETAFKEKRYAFPIIRLADIYLLYAEALTEYKDAPDDEAYFYLDEVRRRAGLEGVKDSWKKYSVNAQKPENKEGLLEIIRQERLNELALEGQRFWDLRRWKWSEKYMNMPLKGWNVFGENVADFYKVIENYYPVFGRKDYFWPVKQDTRDRNSNLMQNPGWL